MCICIGRTLGQRTRKKVLAFLEPDSRILKWLRFRWAAGPVVSRGVAGTIEIPVGLLRRGNTYLLFRGLCPANIDFPANKARHLQAEPRPIKSRCIIPVVDILLFWRCQYMLRRTLPRINSRCNTNKLLQIAKQLLPMFMLCIGKCKSPALSGLNGAVMKSTAVARNGLLQDPGWSCDEISARTLGPFKSCV